MEVKNFVMFLIIWFVVLVVAFSFVNVWLILLCIFSPLLVMAIAEGNPNKDEDGDW